MKEWTPTYPLGDAPTGEGEDGAVDEWRVLVQDWRATQNYDEMRMHCYWCASDDDLMFATKGTRGGVLKYCSEECRDTAAFAKSRIF